MPDAKLGLDCIPSSQRARVIPYLIVIFSFILSNTGSLATASTPPLTQDIEFDHLEQNSIVFSSSKGGPLLKPLNTGLYELTFLGKLNSRESEIEPYFLFSGKTCDQCQEDRMIYAVRPSGGKPIGFVYPGKILEIKSKNLVFKSNAFIGKCLRNKPEDVLVIFQNEKIDRRNNLASSVLIVKPEKHYLQETLIEKNIPSLQITQKLAKTKACKEIEGRNRLTMNKKIDARLPARTLGEIVSKVELPEATDIRF